MLQSLVGRWLRCARVAVAASIAMLAGPAQASLLNLDLLLPDIESAFITVNYDATANLFTASGITLTLDFDGVAPPDQNIANGSFGINVFVDETGVLAAGGSLEITGTVLGFGPSLLTGDLVALGFMDSGGEIFEFVFELTGGDLSVDFGSVVGVILNAGNSGFAGSFDVDFSNSGFAGVSDTAPIPAPATGLLFMFAAALWRRPGRSRAGRLGQGT